MKTFYSGVLYLLLSISFFSSFGQNRVVSFGDSSINLTVANGSHLTASTYLEQPRIEVLGESNSSQDESNRFIIQFREEHSGEGNRALSIANRFQKFRSDLRSIAQARTSTLSQTEPEVIHEFSKSFYGASVSGIREMLDDIRSLQYVKMITPVSIMEADLDESIQVIGIDSVHKSFEIFGEGIVVGIIDSGIDYNHPALGGGFGNGFKVIDGYDFVNMDDDPMDDNGHGTHVAGIVAGESSEIIGAAPGASLVALKALNHYGGGYEDDIIAAIEWTIDPNGDGLNDDHLDVVNMSLGGTGTHESPLALAVNNAVDMGIVFCVSAGNRYSNYSIGSPGTAEKAITVGATNNGGNYVDGYSSKGPNPGNYIIKPDLVAPGSDINSSLPGGEYGSQNGTSMSTPHIAGLVALMLGVYPDLSPEEVKARLMNTAKPFPGRGVMDQGSGLVDAVSAMNIESLLIPSALNLGVNSLGDDHYANSVSVNLSNESSEPKGYSIDLGTIPTGVSITVNLTEFTLNPGESTTLDFELNVDNTTFIPTTDQSLTTGGHITINEGETMMVLPWAFVTGVDLTFNFDSPFPIFSIKDRDNWSTISSYSFSMSEDGLTAKALVPQGLYDMEFLLGDWSYLVLKENIDLSGIHSIDIFLEHAENKVVLKPQDISGNSLADYPGNTTVFVIKPNDIGGQIVWFGSHMDTLRISSFNDFDVLVSDFWDGRLIDTQNNTFYKINHKINSLENDSILTNKDLDFHQVNLLAKVPDPIDAQAYFMESAHRSGDDWGSWGVASGSWRHIEGQKEVEINYYTTDPQYTGSWQIGTYLTANNGNQENYKSFRSRDIKVYNDSLGTFEYRLPKKEVNLVPQGGEIILGSTMIYPSVYDIYNWVELKGAHNETMGYAKDDFVFKLMDEDMNLISSGGWSEVVRGEALEYGSYFYEMTGETKGILGQEVLTSYRIFAKLTSGEGHQYNNLPFAINSISLVGENGIPRNNLEFGKSHKLKLSLHDYHQWDYDSVKVGIKISNQTDWIEIDADSSSFYHNQVNHFVAPMDVVEASSTYDLKVVAYTSLGDSLQYTLSPAFSTSRDKRIPQIVSLENKVIHRNKIFQIKASDITVEDSDNIYPDEFLIQPYTGLNYSIDGLNIVPEKDFLGKIYVPISVSDGVNQSELRNMEVDVVNDIPAISSQVDVSLGKNQVHEIILNNLIITDEDDHEFDLLINNGDEFDLQENSIIPSTGYVGYLPVDIRATDGFDTSSVFTYQILYWNAIPKIIGQSQMEIDQKDTIDITADHLIIEDADDTAFQILISPDSNFDLIGENRLTPASEFEGELAVPLYAFDGTDSSDVYIMKINVDVSKDENSVVSGIDDTEILRVFPNPVNSKLHLHFPFPGDFLLQDLSGKSLDIRVISKENNHVEIDLSQIPKGIYLLTIFGKTNAVFRVIKM